MIFFVWNFIQNGIFFHMKPSSGTDTAELEIEMLASDQSAFGVADSNCYPWSPLQVLLHEFRPLSTIMDIALFLVSVILVVGGEEQSVSRTSYTHQQEMKV